MTSEVEHEKNVQRLHTKRLDTYVYVCVCASILLLRLHS